MLSRLACAGRPTKAAPPSGATLAALRQQLAANPKLVRQLRKKAEAMRQGVRTSATSPHADEYERPGTPMTSDAHKFKPEMKVYSILGAFKIEVVDPIWIQLNNGTRVVEREGCFRVTVATVKGKVEGTDRCKYNWEVPSFNLTPQEAVGWLTLAQQSYTYMHDTFKGQQGKEGLLVKYLSWSPSVDPATPGYIITHLIVDSREKELGEQRTETCCLLDAANFYIIKQLVDSCLPRVYGFDAIYRS